MKPYTIYYQYPGEGDQIRPRYDVEDRNEVWIIKTWETILNDIQNKSLTIAV